MPKPGSTIAYLRENGGGLGQVVGDMVDAAYAKTSLDPKTRELIFIAIGSAVHMPASIVSHVHRAYLIGCPRSEIVDAVMIGCINGGINGAVDGLPAALATLDALEAQRGEAGSPPGAGAPGARLTVGELVDRHALENHVTGFVTAIDEKRWADAAQCCSPEAQLVLPRLYSHSAGPGTAESCAEAYGRFGRTQHSLTNARVQVDRDKATVEAYVHATHVHGDDPHAHWDLGGCIRFECGRADDGWRIENTTLRIEWQSGRLPDDRT